ncbi:hypothetical protein AALB39_07955 [Lachnospiraceae bacterium 54-53]
MEGNVKLHNLTDREKTGYTTWGCMWDQGACGKDRGYILRNKDRSRVPMQSRITAWWPDGTVKWTAHTARADDLTGEIEVVPAEEGDPEERNTGEALRVVKDDNGFWVEAGTLRLHVPKDGRCLFDSLEINGEMRAGKARPVLLLEEPVIAGGLEGRVRKPCEGTVEEVTIREEGPLRAVIQYRGIHVSGAGERKLPFLIRMSVGLSSRRLSFTHTFLYDGDEEKDFLKGIGLSVRVPVKGAMYNRHVMFEGDHGVFHETMAELLTWRPRVPSEIYRSQMKGERLDPRGTDREIIEKVLPDMPFWDEYRFCQDSPSHFAIKKKTGIPDCCLLDCLHGRRTKGAAAFGGENGSMACSIRDFWQTYPSGYTFRGLTAGEAEAVIWLYSPEAQAMDFRHYTDRGYNQVYYEGYDYKGASAYGIASTSEYSLEFYDGLIPSEEELHGLSRTVNAPAQYVGTPEYYHGKRAFGYWSLPRKENETEEWLEKQLDLAADFYEKEVDQRNWYGLFNYGDFMHTYDPERHQWRYDMGGYAWDNTELVPTLWLWLAFLRTGRTELFALGEKLTRHASEVDVYHFGKYKGLGSRHNVRHWGCPCKEARIAMAAHHRYYYYLTGDYRLEDIFEELKDNERTFLNKDPLGDFYEKKEMVYKSHARSGPDWSSLCANWMTRWERFHDDEYREKIVTGVEDIKKAPLKLVSGPDFEFDPESVHLRYIGERAAGGTHLQICMGAPQVWMEMADLLGDEEWKEMMAEYGRFYYLPREKQLEESRGIIGDREFSLPFMAAAMGAYGAWYYGDRDLAKTTWRHLLHAILREGNHDGFQTVTGKDLGNRERLVEIPWISTNFAAQWCLNVICSLEFIRDQLPGTLREADELVAKMTPDSFRRA